jgi:hypothetical protein
MIVHTALAPRWISFFAVSAGEHPGLAGPLALTPLAPSSLIDLHN